MNRPFALTRVRAILAGVVASLAVCSAQAFSGDIGNLEASSNPGSALTLGLFPGVETLTFSLAGPTKASFAVQSQSLNLGFVIPGATGLAFALFKGNVMLTAPSTAVANLTLAAGMDYSFKVIGTSVGLYTMNWALSPVPEPDAGWLVIAGFGAVGLLARRRGTKLS
ncbi:MAG: PEP-CTERM sorting domain-containing protein [Rubrivivax sp.]|nr:MAG: PEP-CTERM sorting domain-containing protein [Rubrivivax sp.]